MDNNRHERVQQLEEALRFILKDELYDANPEAFARLTVERMRAIAQVALKPSPTKTRPDGAHRCLNMRRSQQCRLYLDHTGDCAWDSDEVSKLRTRAEAAFPLMWGAVGMAAELDEISELAGKRNRELHFALLDKARQWRAMWALAWELIGIYHAVDWMHPWGQQREDISRAHEAILAAYRDAYCDYSCHSVLQCLL